MTGSWLKNGDFYKENRNITYCLVYCVSGNMQYYESNASEISYELIDLI